jgi:LemA protein
MELIVVGGLIALVGIVLIVIYNGLIAKKNQVENAFSGMDVMLKKRFDLIPNLVATVRQYAKHEAETLSKVTEMRARAMNPATPSAERVAIENQVTRALGGIMVAVEQYPQLKADANFRDLQASLNEIEEQISASRRSYNASVTDLNNAVEMFPSSIVASMMGLGRRELFEVPQAQRENVNVRELFNS